MRTHARPASPLLLLVASLTATAACGTTADEDADVDASDVDARDADGATPVDASDADALDTDAGADAALDASDAHADVVSRDAPADVPPTEPNFDTLPWRAVGTGVAYKDSENPRGENVFIAYAGFDVTQAESETWVTMLYHAWLRAHGVRYVYAVQGPDTVTYSNREIQNTHLIANLLPTLSPATHFVAVVGHSSGGYVACEFMQQLYEGGLDPSHLTHGRTVYFDMDAVESCVDPTIVSNLRRVYFMSAHTNVAPGGVSLNYSSMMMGAARVGSGGFHVYDASGSGCVPSASLCLHVSLINTHPNDPNNGLPTDYSDYAHGMVNDWFLTTGAADLPM